jgi:hypothetical protein
MALTTDSQAKAANPSNDDCWVGSAAKLDCSQTHHAQQVNANRALIAIS